MTAFSDLFPPARVEIDLGGRHVEVRAMTLGDLADLSAEFPNFGEYLAGRADLRDVLLSADSMGLRLAFAARALGVSPADLRGAALSAGDLFAVVVASLSASSGGEAEGAAPGEPEPGRIGEASPPN